MPGHYYQGKGSELRAFIARILLLRHRLGIVASIARVLFLKNELGIAGFIGRIIKVWTRNYGLRLGIIIIVKH